MQFAEANGKVVRRVDRSLCSQTCGDGDFLKLISNQSAFNILENLLIEVDLNLDFESSVHKNESFRSLSATRIHIQRPQIDQGTEGFVDWTMRTWIHFPICQKKSSIFWFSQKVSLKEIFILIEHTFCMIMVTRKIFFLKFRH